MNAVHILGCHLQADGWEHMVMGGVPQWTLGPCASRREIRMERRGVPYLVGHGRIAEG